MTAMLAPTEPVAVDGRAALAAEWAARHPQTPAEILAFYRETPHLAADLAAFHAEPFRQRWTEILVYLAGQEGVQAVLDIGCGAGHDLLALRQAHPHLALAGVEPNTVLRQQVTAQLQALEGHTPPHLHATLDAAPVETADLLICCDVLEHVPAPETFLGEIAQRAPLGARLVETCATWDITTPLHLPSNYGWRPGRVLEAHGWEKLAEEGRLRVWQRVAATPSPHVSLILCGFRSCTLSTMRSILSLVEAPNPLGWRVYLCSEAGINRARSIAVSRWYTETAEDVFLFVDDDITFTADAADRLVQLCREGHEIICAAYPVRDGGHLALRGLGAPLAFGAGLPPVEIQYAATGFMACHRRVVERLIQDVPLCHANSPAAFWPIFDFAVVPDAAVGGHNYLSEDWLFCERARAAGFHVWLDPTIRLGHQGMVEFTVQNMYAVKRAVEGGA